MKGALIFAVFGACIALSYSNCWFKDDCEPTHCCVKIMNMVAKCMPKLGEGKTCGSKEIKQPLKDHIHWFQCPCEDGLTCVKKEGLIGHVVGKCEAGSGEDGNGGAEE